MKLKKFLKKIYHHEYGTGSTFYMKDNGTIDTANYIEYRYDSLADIHSLYLIELKHGTTEVLHQGELPASLLINQSTRFILKDFVEPKHQSSK